MPPTRYLAEAMFDGIAFRDPSRAPFLVTVGNGTIIGVDERAFDAPFDIQVPFLMPGFAEAHAHIFLDGGELDLSKRNAYLQAGQDEMMAVARANVGRSIASGVTLIRDAGDRYGINDAIRLELASDRNAHVVLRSPGLALKRPKRYGAFMALDVDLGADCAKAAEEQLVHADDLKIILTGIVDFSESCVKGNPQFDAAELSAMVKAAHARGRKTFVHCSGLAGLQVAVEANVDSIEHGYFMTRDILEKMADKGIAWVPTVSPVHFQWARPEFAGWAPDVVENLRRILDSHMESIAMAHRLGVNLVAGSDAGSPGVVHGTALLDEIFFFLEAGLPIASALECATIRPRKLWGASPNQIAPQNQADLIVLPKSPEGNPSFLREAKALPSAK